MSDARKDAIRAYKERAVPRGIFAVRCTATGQVWVGTTPTLDTMQNRLWFTLRSGIHRNRAMQAAWVEHGEESFRYEILERLDDTVPALLLNDTLKERNKHWLTTIGAAPVER